MSSPGRRSTGGESPGVAKAIVAAILAFAAAFGAMKMLDKYGMLGKPPKPPSFQSELARSETLAVYLTTNTKHSFAVADTKGNPKIILMLKHAGSKAVSAPQGAPDCLIAIAPQAPEGNFEYTYYSAKGIVASASQNEYYQTSSSFREWVLNHKAHFVKSRK